jgi:hypothetical protein
MMTYGGLFEAVVDNGDLTGKTGKLTFELRGEAHFLLFRLRNPLRLKQMEHLLKFRKTRLGKESVM